MRRAFTLIELVVVLLLLALLAGGATWSLRGITDNYRLSQAAESLEMFDARARRIARYVQSGATAFIDSDQGILRITAKGQTDPKRYRIPKSVEIAEIRSQNQSHRRGLRFNSRGLSPSYGIRLQRGDRTSWIVVLGSSGQILKSVPEEQVNALLGG